MKHYFYNFICSCALLLFVVMPQSARAQVIVDESVYRTSLLQLIKLLQVQVGLLQEELSQQKIVEIIPELESAPTFFGDRVQTVAIYDIKNQTDVYAIADSTHRQYFQRVFALFPEEYDGKIGRLVVFDGESIGDVDAFVETIPPEHNLWTYAVSDSILTEVDSIYNVELIVHELGHLVSYEDVVGVPKPTITKCVEYFKRHGCPSIASFLGQFVQEFWSDDDLARATSFNQTEDFADKSYEYYLENTDNFVTDYAAVGPEEDFAESFMFFVLEEEVQGRISQNKINFFAQQQELVLLAAEINSKR